MSKGLGKGINALFANVDVNNGESIQEIALNNIRPNPYQPRKTFEKESIEELKQSILEHGVLQPIIVRRSIKGFEIVVGERRYRACKEARLSTIPAVIRELTEQQMMELALLENLQREDLTPIEEAIAYSKLLKSLQLTQEELAVRIGKSRPHIANHLRLLTLPKKVQQFINENQLSMGHGRALLGLKDTEKLTPLSEKIVREKLSVRHVEQLVQKLNEHVPRETKTAPKKDVFLKESESVLRERLGTAVTIKRQKKKGKIEIEFFSNEDLERILHIIEHDLEGE
ncbi:ParB/RepB/Spo0J family partition protein [Bacillus carboniphilus]|uniref:ParB/RepB/Spo0J family partition protein n=1 Tax=Bacillus carboniphilus TaxID=86663 RepID=A0ABY9JTW8_9BACI|nr:ParB/RepB/Spo0J family partition protein [Bacillus carboniphilus]WLR41880.1 ParB/RepB/Spo0J family partition protein [Bacillus carboniphilus]